MIQPCWLKCLSTISIKYWTWKRNIFFACEWYRYCVIGIMHVQTYTNPSSTFCKGIYVKGLLSEQRVKFCEKTCDMWHFNMQYLFMQTRRKKLFESPIYEKAYIYKTIFETSVWHFQRKSVTASEQYISIYYIPVCRNNCSDHGYCDSDTKRCVCDSFWMANFFKSNFGEKESNCSK